MYDDECIHTFIVVPKKYNSHSTRVIDCSQPSILWYFYSLVKRAGRIGNQDQFFFLASARFARKPNPPAPPASRSFACVNKEAVNSLQGLNRTFSSVNTAVQAQQRRTPQVIYIVFRIFHLLLLSLLDQYRVCLRNHLTVT